MKRRCQYSSMVALFLVVACSGCGGDKIAGLAPVTGTVTYNGKAVEGAGVIFVPAGGGIAGIGTTDKDGRFTIFSRTQEGVAIGACKVSVAKTSGAAAATGAADVVKSPGAEVSEDERKKMMEQGEKMLKGNPGAATPNLPKNELPAKYADAATSGLEFTVKSGKNDFKIDLTD